MKVIWLRLVRVKLLRSGGRYVYSTPSHSLHYTFMSLLLDCFADNEEEDYADEQMTDGMQESYVPGATGSASGPGWWTNCEEVFRMEG